VKFLKRQIKSIDFKEMLGFFSHIFDSKLSQQTVSGGGNAQQNKLIQHRVEEIESHLDDFSKFPMARLQSAPYNLIDWNVGPGRKVTSPIYLGSALALTDQNLLSNVGAVLTIIDPGRAPKGIVQQALLRSDGPYPRKSHLYLPLDDHPGEDISKYFDRASEFLRYYQDRGVPILVHCMAGMSRSATLLANYLMRKYKINAFTALDLIKKRRPIVRPNSGFIRQLVAHDK